MTMRAALFGDQPIPEETVQLAHAIYPDGNRLMQLRDHFGMLFESHQFSALFSHTGQPALAPARLALVTILQFMEDLSDRQAADAVRLRIDWKYLLGLPLADRGFHYSVLSEFRSRLVTAQREQLLLDTLLTTFQDHDLLRARGQQRTDSTHVLAAVRGLTRIECVGETMRATLNTLAKLAPDWLCSHVPADWFDRYGPRFDSYRFPKAAADRQHLAEEIGADGFQLLAWLAASDAPPELHAHPAVGILRQVWWQQYYAPNGPARWRDPADSPQAVSGLTRPTTPMPATAPNGVSTGWATKCTSRKRAMRTGLG
jgi:transposase